MSALGVWLEDSSYCSIKRKNELTKLEDDDWEDEAGGKCISHHLEENFRFLQVSVTVKEIVVFNTAPLIQNSHEFSLVAFAWIPTMPH